MREEKYHKIESYKRRTLPDHPLSGVMGYVLKFRRVPIDFFRIRGIEEDFYQSCIMFYLQTLDEYQNEFGTELDSENMSELDMRFVVNSLSRKYAKFIKNYGTSKQISENTVHYQASESENGETDWGLSTEKDPSSTWFLEHMEMAESCILSDENPETNKQLQFEIYKIFVQFGYLYREARFRELNPYKSLMDLIRHKLANNDVTDNQIATYINSSIKLIRSSFGIYNADDLTMGTDNLFVVGNEFSKSKIEFELPSDLSKSERVKIVREKLGIDDERFKTMKGYIYLLIARAEKNNGKAVYYPEYQKNRRSKQKQEDSTE